VYVVGVNYARYEKAVCMCQKQKYCTIDVSEGYPRYKSETHDAIMLHSVI
jgi:hypothetical protein